jgi:hypothetical protein
MTSSLERRIAQAEWELWVDEVDAIVTRRVGRSVFTLGDFDLASMWLDEDTPTDAARSAVRLARAKGTL